MLIEFYERAQQIIKKHCPDIDQKTESETMLYVKGEGSNPSDVANLIRAFEKENYGFALAVDCEGYVQVLQPDIPYSPKGYGHIPEGYEPVTEQENKIQNNQRPGGLKAPMSEEEEKTLGLLMGSKSFDYKN